MTKSAAGLRRGIGGETVLVMIVVACVACLTLLPIVRLCLSALLPAGHWDGAGFLARLMRPQVMRAAIHTLDTSVWGALAAMVIGVPFALGVALTDLPGRRQLGFCLILPLMIAPQVTALAWLHLFGPSSTLMAMLGAAPPIGSVNPMLGREGIILLFGVQHAPIVFITVRAGLSRLPGDLVEAARASGAGPIRAVLTIVLPLIRPHLMSGLMLAFLSGIGNFGIPALLGMPVNYLTLTTLIYQRLASNGPEVLPELAALSLAIGMLALAGMALQAVILPSRRAHRLGSGAPARLSLGRARGPVAVVAWGMIGLILILPTLALMATALIPAFGVPLTLRTVTADNFVEVLLRQASTIRAFVNSSLLSALAAIALSCLAVPLGWILAQRSATMRAGLQGVIALPYAIPGIVLSIACILLFLRPLPLIGSLYGTPWIILIAYLMRFLTLASNPVTSLIGQIPRNLDEAAAASGAGPIRRLLTIITPLAAASALAGGLLVFMSAFNELTVSALLWSNGSETIGVVLFSLEEAGLGTQAAAIAVVSLAIVIVLLACVDRLGRRLPAGILPWR